MSAQLSTQAYNHLRDLASEIAAPSSPPPAAAQLNAMQGVVTAVDWTTTPPSLTVQLQGDTSTSIPGIPFAVGYLPAVGDVVILGKKGTDLFALCRLTGTATDAPTIPVFSSQAAVDAAFPNPVTGQTIVRSDIGLCGCEMRYSASLGAWKPSGDCLLGETTLAANSSGDFTFSSISQAFRELELTVAASGSDTANHGTYMYFNGGGTTDYDYTGTFVTNSATSIFANQSQGNIWIGETIGATFDTRANSLIVARISNYSNSNFATVAHHGYAGDQAVTTQWCTYGGGTWRNGSAVTSISISPSTGVWQTGSRFALIGKV